MIENRAFRVEQGGVRLDAALLNAFPSSSRAFVREAVERGDVLVDGRRAAKGLKLRGGETVAVSALAEQSDNVVSPNRAIGISVVFEDASIVALDKPAGLPVQPL